MRKNTKVPDSRDVNITYNNNNVYLHKLSIGSCTMESSSLADKIADILNIAPVDFNPEDGEGPSPKVLDQHNEVHSSEFEHVVSKFRRANVDLLADLDPKYAGKKTNRKAIRSYSEEEDDDHTSDEDTTENNSSNLKFESFYSDNSRSSSGSAEDTTEDTDGSGDTVEEMEENKFDDSFKHIEGTFNDSSPIKKGLCVKNQMIMWENLLEVRIQLQKCLLTANMFPQNQTFNTITEECGQEFANKLSHTKRTVGETLNKLLLLQKLLLKQYPETKNMDGSIVSNPSAINRDDEEIASDTDNEECSYEEVEVELKKANKRKITDYEQELAEHHKKYKSYRNDVIKKWNDKTRVALKGTTSHSVLDQIEYNLRNKENLVKRTQIKRSQYLILGSQADETDENCNSEIFDDDDFYHQLLRELIEIKSSDVTDSVELGRQWISLQNLRSKMKRKIDTRATKGRKIRYAVHSKLVNFMAPVDENSWTDAAKNELYNSLFGNKSLNSNL